jgi:hypothetical protein
VIEVLQLERALEPMKSKNHDELHGCQSIFAALVTAATARFQKQRLLQTSLKALRNLGRPPKIVAVRQPWAECCNPFGIEAAANARTKA